MNQTVKPELKSPEMKAARVAIVNEIIKEIASRGRRFFAHEDKVAYLYLKNGKIWYKCEWVSTHQPITDVCFSIPKYRKPKRGFTHGGTLESLVRDFCDFIRKGGDTNHNHGYGGLYCTHWGYPAEDMKAIRAKAIELGYMKLKEGGKQDGKG